MKYNWNQNDTAIIFDPVFEMPKGSNWAMPHMNVDLYIPENTKVIFTKRMAEFLYYSDANIARENWEEWSDRWNSTISASNLVYIMGPDGLKKLK